MGTDTVIVRHLKIQNDEVSGLDNSYNLRFHPSIMSERELRWMQGWQPGTVWGSRTSSLHLVQFLDTLPAKVILRRLQGRTKRFEEAENLQTP
jgi:hypothetical protein